MSIVIFIIGLVLAIAGAVMLVVAAFRKSVPWGIASILIPFAAFVFTFLNWDEAKSGFLTMIVGIVLLYGGGAMAPS